MQYAELETDLNLVEEQREDGDTCAVVTGIAVPYNSTITVGAHRESFAPESVDPAQSVGSPVLWRHDEPVGVIRAAKNTPGGLVVEMELAATQRGTDTATLVRTGSVKGLSIGFVPVEDEWDTQRTHVTRMKAQLNEVSLTHMPAYSGAAVTAVREYEEMQETQETPEVRETVEAPAVAELREGLEEVRDTIATMQVTERPTQPQTAEDFLREYGEALVKRDWTNIVIGTQNPASDVGGVPSTVSARIDLGRPTWAAIGAEALGEFGMQSTWLLDDVDPTMGTQSAEKTTIPSGAFGGKFVEAPVVTIASGNDISLQWLARSNPYNFSDYLQRLGEMYARQTNAQAVGLLATATKTTTLPVLVEPSTVGKMLGDAAASIAADTGWSPNLVTLNPATYFAIATTAGHGYPYAGGEVGNANLTSLSMNAFGLNIICDASLGDAMGYVLNTRAVGLRESPGAPFSVSAPVPEKLGFDFAMYGYTSVAMLRADAVVKIEAGTGPQGKK